MVTISEEICTLWGQHHQLLKYEIYTTLTTANPELFAVVLFPLLTIYLHHKQINQLMRKFTLWNVEHYNGNRKIKSTRTKSGLQFLHSFYDQAHEHLLENVIFLPKAKMCIFYNTTEWPNFSSNIMYDRYLSMVYFSTKI